MGEEGIKGVLGPAPLKQAQQRTSVLRPRRASEGPVEHVSNLLEGALLELACWADGEHRRLGEKHCSLATRLGSHSAVKGSAEGVSTRAHVMHKNMLPLMIVTPQVLERVHLNVALARRQRFASIRRGESTINPDTRCADPRAIVFPDLHCQAIRRRVQRPSPSGIGTVVC